MKFFKKFKKSFSYTWYLYLLAIVIPALVFPFSYSFMHRPKEYETLSIFLSCDINDGAADTLYSDLKDLEIKKAEIVNYNPFYNEVSFDQKLSVVGYNRCDLIVLPKDRCDQVGIFTVALELNDDVKNLCKIDSENFYSFEKKVYGVELQKLSPIRKLGQFNENTDYYVFLNAKSYNIGDFSIKNPHTDNAFKFMQYVLGK